MMNNLIDFTDKQFQPNNSSACHLLIHLDSDSYSYAIVDKEQNRLSVLFKKYFPQSPDTFSAFNRLEILRAENENVNLDFGKVKISVETKAFTFIPEELYASADLPKYGKFIGVEPSVVLLNSDIRPLGIKAIAAVEPNLANDLKVTFSDPLIVSQANPFIAGIYQLQAQGELFLNFNHDSFEAAVFRKGTLELYNIFETSNNDEFNYYILNLINQLELDRNFPVVLSGEIDSGNERYLRLQKYFEQLTFADASLLANGREVDKQFALHRVFSLLSLDLCE